MAFDPNGGGSSCACLISFTLERLNLTLVAMDTHPLKSSEEMQDFLMQHLAGIRGDARFKDSWIIFIAESNLGQEASHSAFFLRDQRRVWCMSEKGRPGVNTTHDRKEKMVSSLLLFVNQQAMSLYKNFITTNTQLCAKTRREKTLEEFKKQFSSFRKIVSKPKEAWKLPRISYSGKGNGNNDDMIMTLLIGAWWAQRFCNREVAAPYEDFI